MAANKDPELYLFLRLEATTGLRPGEVRALWWQDFELDAGELLVGHNVVHTKGLPGGYVRKRTKSVHGDAVWRMTSGTSGPCSSVPWRRPRRSASGWVTAASR